MQFKMHTDDRYGDSCSLCVSRTLTHSSVHGEVQTVKGHIAGHCGHPVDLCCRVCTVHRDVTTPKGDGGDGELITGHTTGQTQGLSFSVAAILNTADQRG